MPPITASQLGHGLPGGRLARLLAIIAGLIAAGCDDPAPPAHLSIAGGDADRGRALIRGYGCGACHTIGGVRGARGVVGPPLIDFARRQLLAGRMPNVPRNLIPWLLDPPSLAPETGMPRLGLTEAEARDIATYLYTLGADDARIHPLEPLPRPAPSGLSVAEPRSRAVVVPSRSDSGLSPQPGADPPAAGSPAPAD